MEWTIYLRTLLALVFVLGLISLLTWAARRYGFGGMPRTLGKPRRLQVVESLGLDNRRRLVLVRRDGREHLLLLGAAGDLVVENGIARAEREEEAS
ncbi:flagellar biosynthesis protein, FliO [mine drainage metagenome]|uniref:Flagellar biosynthesis protein, FliO n=1 Tax=mine drainage metagenome TaxID=410659 RepID=A0A1J5RAW7_9ZZZZ